MPRLSRKVRICFSPVEHEGLMYPCLRSYTINTNAALPLESSHVCSVRCVFFGAMVAFVKASLRS